MMTIFERFMKKLNSDALAHYYQRRLENGKSRVEIEAILYTQSLLSLYEWDEENHSEELK
ncbi:hypothetical protein [Vibrio sp. HN007]|uniref:hypothetical protein n=1 Tax=Vibrio iocasae TaxID=3098914 RepID=UPI0035D49F77